MTEKNLEHILQQVLANQQAHGRLLSVLAHLEYVGARKIAKALPAEKASVTHLEHLMEESRHATLLSQQAEKILGEKGHAWGKRAENYLQAVDHGIDACLRHTTGTYRAFETYLVVSLIIEERAMWFYPLYHRLLPEGSVKGAVQSILKDEVGHLEDMQQYCSQRFSEFPELFVACRQVESQAYENYLWPVLNGLIQDSL